MAQSGRNSSWIIRSLLRLLVLIALGYGAGVILNRTTERLAQETEPAGFGRGLVQGALMPCTLPALLLGRDVDIYTVRNNGLPYKRGYTAGVSVCGALFFGLLYRRLGRWRNRS